MFKLKKFFLLRIKKEATRYVPTIYLDWQVANLTKKNVRIS